MNQSFWSAITALCPGHPTMEDSWMGREFRLTMFEEVAHTKSLQYKLLLNFQAEMFFITLHVSWQTCDWATQHIYERRRDLNTSQKRPALAQQPSMYLEPKWLRYLMGLHIITCMLISLSGHQRPRALEVEKWSPAQLLSLTATPGGIHRILCDLRS